MLDTDSHIYLNPFQLTVAVNTQLESFQRVIVTWTADRKASEQGSQIYIEILNLKQAQVNIN